MTKYTLPGLRLGATSFVLPADYVTGLRWAAAFTNFYPTQIAYRLSGVSQNKSSSKVIFNDSNEKLIDLIKFIKDTDTDVLLPTVISR